MGNIQLNENILNKTKYDTLQHGQKSLHNCFQATEINTMLLAELLQLAYQ